MPYEKRLVKVEFRVVDTDKGKKLRGEPIVYDSPSEDLGGFVETIKPGAATESLKRSDPRALYGHNSDSLLPLGRLSAGTLRQKETKKGVEIEIDPPDSQFSKDLMHSIERGDIQDMSFGFNILEDAWSTRDGIEHRDIIKFDEIFDYSFVAFPAYPTTSAEVRGKFFDNSIALKRLNDNKSSANTGKNSVTAENEDIEIDLLLIKTEDLL